MNEEWKSIPIPDMPREYVASNLGRIKKLEYHRDVTTKTGATYRRWYNERMIQWRLGKPTFKGVKHPVITIYKGVGRENQRGDETRVAYIVCAAFHGIPWSTAAERMKWRIRFKDGNYMNCYADNLEWVHVTGESGGEAQERYARNKDAWESRPRETPEEWAARMGYDTEDAA